MSKNDITGDNIKSRANTKEFDNGFDLAFKNKTCTICKKDIQLLHNITKTETGIAHNLCIAMTTRR